MERESRGQPMPAPTTDNQTLLSGVLASFRQSIIGKWTPWLVLLASLLTTAVVGYFTYEATQRIAQHRFDFRVETIKSAIRTRLMAYEQGLRGGVALFAASPEVSRERWRTYAETLQISQYYPGIQGIGFAQRIRPWEKEFHLRRMRAEGFPHYNIRPEGERPEYTSIIYLEPLDWRNERALGYDMFSEPVRQKAMSRARDTGLATVSGKVTLVQEAEKDIQTGFLMYLPVYRPGTPLETPEQRREALRGYVYSPFRMNDFMHGVLGVAQEDVELHIFNGDKVVEEELMYNTSLSEGTLSQHQHRHLFTHQSILEFNGHKWLLDFSFLPRFEAGIDKWKSYAILTLGLIVSFLLSAMVWSLSKSQAQAMALANSSVEMEEANRKLMQEVAQRQRTEEELRQKTLGLEEVSKIIVEQNERLADLDRKKSEFLNMVAHDLRTPLTSIKSYADLLLMYKDEPSETQGEFLNIISQESTRLGNLINDFLDLARIESGTMQYEMDIINLGELVGDSLKVYGGEAQRRGIDLDVEIDPALPLIEGDKASIGQALSNLLGNAMKYTPDGGHVQVKAQPLSPTENPGQPMVEVSVADSGPGIDAQYHRMIFDKFSQVASRAAKEKEGTGLGLAIVKGIVDHHGGRIWVESEPGQGARFIFTLPVKGTPKQG